MKKSLIVMTLALSSLPFVAQAKPTDGSLEVLQIEVPYSDLNLAHPAGAETMLRRIKSAAAHVCGDATSREMRERTAVRRCMRDAIEGAIAQLHAPLVTALYEKREAADAQIAGR